ncbi:helix-turn-helix transcriptional regulator [Rossellomorea marisflavi]|uniref:Helix-turn-helix transcriptional regulator n=1 Tax=Rossellomorea marisflavi TaxID=189381 RepID=A0A5D4RYG4_9BACI|nr:helix-turn-helix transcriptional regulator [Rossellomorea marisflavi]
MRSKIIGRCLLRTILDHRRMSQEDLVVKTGIHKSQINEYIHNKRIMSLKSARIISKSCKCSIDDLYEWLD